ncbi:MAG: HIT family protein [DPANN group archaeon]|nr:HIT family protein [DPANN group archaeon]
MDCIFCKIISGDIPAKIVYEDATSIAFLDITPCAKGHTVVIPKKHYDTFQDIDENAVRDLFTSVKMVAKAVEKGTGADGSNIGLNNKKAAGQEVPHIHIHIIPRYEGDGGGAIQSIINTHPNTDNLDDLKEKIKYCFKKI